MRSWHHPMIESRATHDKGLGLFAKGPIQKGELICITMGQILTTEQVVMFPMPYHAFQIEQDLQLAPTDLSTLTGIFVTNHSCSPNAGIRNAASLVALKDIKDGDEICYDYCMTDRAPGDQATVTMECQCGYPNCRRTITDLDYRLPLLRWAYHGYFSTFIERPIIS